MLSLPLRRCLALGLGLALAAPAAAASRVILPRIPDSSGLAPGDDLSPLVALYLRERLAECSGVRIVSEGRAHAVLGELTRGLRDSPTNSLADAVDARLPVDAVVRTAHRGDSFAMAVHLAGATREFSYGDLSPGRRQAVVQQLAGDLGRALGLAEPDLAILGQRRIEDDAVFHACYYSQIIWAPWPRNPGDARIELLRPIFAKHPTNAALASRVVADAHVLLRSTSRGQGMANTAVALAVNALPVVLGTPFESTAYDVARDRPAAFEADLIAMARPLTVDAVDAVMEDLSEEAGAGLEAEIPSAGLDVGAVDRVGKAQRSQRLGALRLLGIIQSARGLPLMLAAAASGKDDVREAAAFALRHLAAEAGLPELKRLASDPADAVAFTASVSLWKRELPADRLLPLARSHAAEPRCAPDAAAALAALGGAEDVPILTRLAEANAPDVRAAALDGLLRLHALNEAAFLALLADPDEATVLTAVRHVPPTASQPVRDRLAALANDPLPSVSEAARLALRPFRPAAEAEAQALDLRTEHPYVRKRILDRLAAQEGEAALAELAAQCANPDPHARAHALGLLLKKAPERGHPALVAALRDAYRWPRLHAAALLAGAAQPGDAEAIRAAAAVELDPAIRLYLDDALARAEGKSPPPPRPAARSVEGRSALTWLCGFSAGATNSPFGAYYCLSAEVSDEWKRHYESGKIFFGRVTPVGNPGLIITDPHWLDQFWLSVNAQLTDANLPWLDGVVYGEETMSFGADALWATGWRLFCLDAGLDPERVRGSLDALDEPAKRAWQHWALEKCVEGFNALYDYTKQRAGKLRPGLQVATFLPGQGAHSPADRRWRFDVGGIYDYKGCNRIAAYTLIRRMQTLWPERPVIWLSLGIGGYEMNPVRYTQRTPQSPLLTRRDRAYADTISAWLAGADAGWFSTWVFVAHDFRGGMADLAGVQILAEDIYSNTNLVWHGIEYAFRGVDDLYALKAMGQPTLGDGIESNAVEDVELLLQEPESRDAPRKAQIADEKVRMFDGFQFYGKYVYDCGRVFSDLPRLRYSAPALLIQPGLSVWTRPTPLPAVPAFALFSQYDFLMDVNQAAGADLARYRVIAVDRPGLLADETIAALTRWLRDVPGVLYVHPALAADNAAEASTPADHDGKLQNDWPWEKDVTCEELGKLGVVKPPAIQTLKGPGRSLDLDRATFLATFKTGGASEPLLSWNERPVLVRWRGPGFKGTVLFDGVSECSRPYVDALRQVLNQSLKEAGAGFALGEALHHQALGTNTLSADCCSPYYLPAMTTQTLAGVDLLTGERNPSVGGGRSGAIVAGDLAGRYVAAHAGVAVLSEAPLASVERTSAGLTVSAPGLLRAASDSGRVTVTAAGAELPAIAEDGVRAWLLYGQTDGAVSIPIGKEAEGGTVVFARSCSPVTVTRAP